MTEYHALETSDSKKCPEYSTTVSSWKVIIPAFHLFLLSEGFIPFSTSPLHFSIINQIRSSEAPEYKFVRLNSTACHCRIPTWDINKQKVCHVHTISHAQVHSEPTSKVHSLLNSGQNAFWRSIFSEAYRIAREEDMTGHHRSNFSSNGQKQLANS
jgi:hypothetical protein